LGVFYAILAIVVFGVLGLSYKLSDKLNCDQQQVNLFMFLSAGIAMLGWGLVTHRMGLAWQAVALGCAMGLICFTSVVAFRKAAAIGRLSTSWTVINLALIVPVMASIFIWKEHPEPKHWAGLGLTLLAIILLGIDIGRAGE
jgi:drug/metabolite transporter (DMT)-like permease